MSERDEERLAMISALRSARKIVEKWRTMMMMTSMVRERHEAEHCLRVIDDALTGSGEGEET